MPGPETGPDDAFVSVHPVLGASLAAGTRLLSPLPSTNLVDPLDGLVALAPKSRGSRIVRNSVGERRGDNVSIAINAQVQLATASYGRAS